MAGFLLLWGAAGQGHAVNWLPFGPDGGDARAFAFDPHDPQHLYLGTTNGWVYESRNGGHGWRRLARMGRRDDLVLDNIVVDPSNPKHLLVGAFALGGATDGGIFISNDGGVSWSSPAEMKGQAVLALAEAPSNPAVMVAGTLKGVYRSMDGGARWRQISPPGSTEIHEVESIAIDPKDPQTIYAGTWHLPWKTTDGGEKWANIKQGIIEDSDVFSILVDPQTPQTVYASACSGIYKSENGGGQFRKVEGIPSSARRTRVLMQDPNHLDTVFAGTTEGLFRSDDGGKIWIRTTRDDLIINDVFIDPADSRKVLLATDRGGVLASDDGGDTFKPANSGFSARQITSLVQDRSHPATVYVGVVNDKAWGGVFESHNGGLNWAQTSSGLDGKDVFSLGQAPDGTILAGTSHGVFRLTDGVWLRAGEGRPLAWSVPRSRRAGKQPVEPRRPASPGGADASVYGLAVTAERVWAATSAGLRVSVDSGLTWTTVNGLPRFDWRFVATARSSIVVGTLHEVMRSSDLGATWETVNLPPGMMQVSAVSVDDSGSIWLGGRDGAFVSSDGGLTWSTPRNLVLSSVNSLYYDQPSQRMLVTSTAESTVALLVQLPARTVSSFETGWNLRFVRPMGDHFIAATMFDGIVVQPRMVVSPYSGGSSSGVRKD